MSIIRQNFGSFGDSANWVTDPYGNAQEKTLSAGNTSVTFDILDNTDSNCYVLCIATASAATPNTQPPKSTATVPTYGSSSISGRKTVTYPITAVTSAQAGSKCRLLVVNERSTSYGGIYNGSSGILIGFDVNKVVHTFTDTGSSSSYAEGYWQATEDCYLCGYTLYDASTMSNNGANVWIDGVMVIANYVSNQSSYMGVCIPVKKGQTISFKTKSSTYMPFIKCYGLKY